MATIALHIRDGIQRVTLKTMLESEGHSIHADPQHLRSDVAFCDFESLSAIDPGAQPVVLLTSTVDIPEAVTAMRSGVWGYIVTPFQPQEAAMAVQRVLTSGTPEAEESLDEMPTMESVEFEHIRKALRLCNGNQARAARALNIGRNTLWRKLKKMEQASKDD